jgi:hypothetical protein
MPWRRMGEWMYRAGLDDMEKWTFFDPIGTRTPAPLLVQPVASRYTDWAIPAPKECTYLEVHKYMFVTF